MIFDFDRFLQLAIDFIDLFDNDRKENGRRFSALRKPQCVSPNKRSNNTLLNSRKTDDSLPISTLVTPAIYHDSDDSRVQIYSSDPGKKILEKEVTSSLSTKRIRR